MDVLKTKFANTYGDDRIFNYPFGAMYIFGVLFICDRQNDKIQAYYTNNGVLDFYFEFSTTELLPEGIIYFGGFLYVIGASSDKIQKYELYTGNFISEITIGSYVQPIAIATDNNHLYTVFKNTIVRSDINGNIINTIGGDGFLNFPRGIVVKDGYVYVADTYNSRIVKYTTSGTYISEYNNLMIKRPTGITIINNMLCITDLTAGKVHFIQTNFKAYSSIGSYGIGDKNFAFPVGIVSDESHIYITDSDNHRVVVYKYESVLETSDSTQITNFISDLYPTGQWWNLNIKSTIYKFHDAIGLFFSRLWSSIKEVDGWILPDNDYFTIDAAEAWERVFGIPDSIDKSFEDRKNAISQRMSYPGEILARQSPSYIQSQLQLAGFDVYVTYNRFAASDIITELGETLFELGSDYDELGGEYENPNRFERREPEAGYTEFIANSLDSSLDANIFTVSESPEMGEMEIGAGDAELNSYVEINRENQLRGTFFISANPYPTMANIPLSRKIEFRDLVLRLKPAQTVAIVYVNYN